jgi:hypothetical protein
VCRLRLYCPSGSGALTGAMGGGGAVLPPAALADARLQAVTIVSPFGREMPPAAALWRPSGAMVVVGCLTASCAHCVRLQAVTIVSPFGREMPPVAATVWRRRDAFAQRRDAVVTMRRRDAAATPRRRGRRRHTATARTPPPHRDGEDAVVTFCRV